MGFPLFDVKKLEEKPKPTDTKQQQQADPRALPGSACPVDPPKPTTYLRDLVVTLLVLGFLAGLIALAYYLPTWLKLRANPKAETITTATALVLY